MSRDPIESLPLLRAVSSAIQTRAIYPKGHPRVEAAVQGLLEALVRCLGEWDEEAITFFFIDQEVLVDDRPVRARILHLAPMMRVFAGLGLERLTLAFGLDLEEGRRLVEGIAGGGALENTDHVVLGRVALDVASAGEKGLRGLVEVELEEADVDEAQDSFLGFRSDREASVERLDRILWRFVEGMESTSRSLLLLAPMRSFDQGLFVHSINVSLLALAQARSLGLAGQALHDIGLAALLHDIGKMSLPTALLEKRGDYSEREWEVVRQHPELGAAQLCGLGDVPPLAVLVAYEHHLRWDGKPSYPEPSRPRFPNLASRLTAVANLYDRAIAGKGLSRGVHSREALEIWREHSETRLDPFLVGNFVMLMSEVERDLPAEE